MWQLKIFQLPHSRGDQKAFGCHNVFTLLAPPIVFPFFTLPLDGNQNPFSHHLV
jgi:hypothetical protein